jgi:hypothetical protein
VIFKTGAKVRKKEEKTDKNGNCLSLRRKETGNIAGNL